MPGTRGSQSLGAWLVSLPGSSLTLEAYTLPLPRLILPRNPFLLAPCMANLRAWPPRAPLALAAPSPGLLSSSHATVTHSRAIPAPIHTNKLHGGRSPRASLACPLHLALPSVPLDIRKRETSSCGEIHITKTSNSWHVSKPFSAASTSASQRQSQRRFNFASTSRRRRAGCRQAAAGSERAQPARE